MDPSADPDDDPEPIARALEAASAALGARAAGYWRLDGAALVLVVFVPGLGLPPEVAASFAEATRRVPLDRRELGIVAAAVEARVVVSIAALLPATTGSGSWLRAFVASRSVAAPLLDPRGAVRAVASVALPEACALPDEAVAELVRARFP